MKSLMHIRATQPMPFVTFFKRHIWLKCDVQVVQKHTWQMAAAPFEVLILRHVAAEPLLTQTITPLKDSISRSAFLLAFLELSNRLSCNPFHFCITHRISCCSFLLTSSSILPRVQLVSFSAMVQIQLGKLPGVEQNIFVYTTTWRSTNTCMHVSKCVFIQGEKQVSQSTMLFGKWLTYTLKQSTQSREEILTNLQVLDGDFTDYHFLHFIVK